MKITIQKWGNSQGIRLSKSILNQMNWRIGDVIQINIENSTLAMKKHKPKKSLAQLFDDYNGESPEVFNWGKPMGQEVW